MVIVVSLVEKTSRFAPRRWARAFVGSEFPFAICAAFISGGRAAFRVPVVRLHVAVHNASAMGVLLANCDYSAAPDAAVRLAGLP
jgi:hypothetical protein